MPEKATVTDNEDGSKTITVEAKEGVGKCTDDGQDGIHIIIQYLTLQKIILKLQQR